MSVITSYEAAFTSLQTGEPYNIETELINSGAALIVPDSESTDSNGDKYHILKLNFDKLNHEKWQKE